LLNDGTGPNDVDAIAIVEKSTIEKLGREIINALGDFKGRLVYALEAEKKFAYNSTSSSWVCQRVPFNDFVLHTEGVANISVEGNASASSVEPFLGNVPRFANDGNLLTRWASGTGMPQWLQIEWPTPRRVTGVHVLFERAYAEDYAVQTWNGTSWVSQVNVTGNTLLNRTHYFSPVETTKLRIYVTSAPAYDMVSIWELEVYAKEISTTNIFIPRGDYYSLAFRLASGPEYGTLNVSLGNLTARISCSAGENDFKWYELGTVYLERGNHRLTMNSEGKIDFDALVLYSTENEEAVSLENLFRGDQPLPAVNYERLSPCKYKVHIKTNKPFFLVFSDSYHPLWKAYVDKKEVSPVVADYLANAFFIDKTGEFDVPLYFTGQSYTELGLKIASVTLIAVLLLIIVPSKTIGRIKTHLKLGERKRT